MARMAALLSDPEPEIRAAAVIGILRVGGDAGIPQLAFLAREKSPGPIEAAAHQLGSMSTPDSGKLLLKLLKRPEASGRLAAAAGLARRNDEAARAALKALWADALAPATLRAQAVGALDVADLAQPATDAVLGPFAYAAYLRAGRRDEAAAWLLPRLDGMSETARLDALSRWLLPAGLAGDAKTPPGPRAP
jgi:HEAT repeat protein